jgi:hypothetical protein
MALTTRMLAGRLVARYPVGAHVDVHIDPEDPGNAVLEPESREGSLAPLIVAAICAVLGGGLLAFFIKVGFG